MRVDPVSALTAVLSAFGSVFWMREFVLTPASPAGFCKGLLTGAFLLLAVASTINARKEAPRG